MSTGLVADNFRLFLLRKIMSIPNISSREQSMLVTNMGELLTWARLPLQWDQDSVLTKNGTLVP